MQIEQHPSVSSELYEKLLDGCLQAPTKVLATPAITIGILQCLELQALRKTRGKQLLMHADTFSLACKATMLVAARVVQAFEGNGGCAVLAAFC